jgi:hypothetical protein
MNQSNSPNEKQVTEIWQNSISSLKYFVDTHGNRLELIYAGRANDTRGGDFRDAVLRYNTHLHRGNIEIHTHTSGWQAHGHHQNPDYNRTVLHIACFQDSKRDTVLENGEKVPTVIIGKYLSTAPSVLKTLPCRNPDNTAFKLSVLEEAGLERFHLKSSALRNEIISEGFPQAFYRSVMEALGYSANKKQFKNLASALPLHALSQISGSTLKHGKHFAGLFPLMLGSAGLLPSQRILKVENCAYVNHLENTWRNMKQSQLTASSSWDTYRIRPVNHPVRRTAAAAVIAERLISEDFLSALERILHDENFARARRSIIRLLTIPAYSYWENHFDFGSPSHVRLPSLLGSERIKIIAVNVILPFFTASSEINKNPEFAALVRRHYTAFPRLPLNSLEKHMAAQLEIPAAKIKNAAVQQGLIHIYQEFCTQGKCSSCRLSA